jgi:hypothetical protein
MTSKLVVNNIESDVGISSVTFADNIQIVSGSQYLTITHQGIDFQNTGVGSSTTATSHFLDDYEEGTWTPTLTSGDGLLSVTYDTSTTKGFYTKIGRLVNVFGRINLASTNQNGTNLYVSGLPFVSTNNNPVRSGYGSVTNVSGFAANTNPHAVLIDSDNTRMQIRRVADTGNSSNPSGSDTTNSLAMYFTAQYIVD